MNTSDFKDFYAKVQKIKKTKAFDVVFNSIVFTSGRVVFPYGEITVEMPHNQIPMDVTFAIDTKFFLTIINEFKNARLTFDFTHNDKGIDKVILNLAGKTYKTPNIDNSCPLPLETDNYEFLMNISKDDVQKISKAVNYSANDIMRPIMHSVLIDKENIVGTDAHAMAFYKRNKKDENTLIVPYEVIPLLSDNGGAVYSMKVPERDTRYMIVESSGIAIYFNEIGGRYPDWKCVIPQDYIALLKISSSELQDLLKSAKIASKNPAIWLRFNGEESKADILVIDDINEFRTSIPVNVIGKQNGYFGFNGNLLGKILKTESYNSCTLKFNGESRALIINDEILMMPLIADPYGHRLSPKISEFINS